MNFAPIVLFVYDRLDHLTKTVEALKANEHAIDSELFVFSDGPKSHNQEQVFQVRKYLSEISGFKSITIEESESNKGLATSIIYGVTKIVEKYGRVIVLEDDIVTSKYFLNYMNSSLEFYDNNERVMHISGYMYPIELSDDIPETFFIKPTSCWGWATWSRAWKHFSNDIEIIESKMTRKMTCDFNLNNSNDFYKQITLNKAKKIKTWAVFWYASSFLANGLSLHPRNSYCENIGHDGSGTNCDINTIYKVELNNVNQFSSNSVIEENLVVRKFLEKYFNSNKISLLEKFVRKIRKIGKI